MYNSTIEHFATLAEKKVAQRRTNLLGFMVGCVLGGGYVGLGVVLILSVGSHLPAEVLKLCMGLTFAVALILVVIAGAELFTGYAMYMTLGRLARRVAWRDLLQSSLLCWLGNLGGAVLVAALFAATGANGLLDDPHSLLFSSANAKIAAGPLVLFAKALLCNWLVCLALWMSGRVDSDLARCAVIFWCLLTFIACGFEHSVANMTVLALAWIGGDFCLPVLRGALYNLAIVTTGNLVGGAMMVGVCYWLADRGASAHGNARRSGGSLPGVD